jgi:phosphoglycerate kinase
MSWKTLDDMELRGKVVLVRVDINVPVQEGRVTDDTRIQRIVPTIRDILAKGGKPVLLAHFDRPKGKVVPEMSLAVTLPALEAALGQKVLFAAGDRAAAVAAMRPGDVVLLENIRFHPGEEQNDPALAQELASLGDVYCNDAFSAAHRAHASTEGVARLMPSCAGRLMAAELAALDAALGKPLRPLVAVVGGAKISTKLDLLSNLTRKVDALIIGGGMANTFLAALGHDVGRSLCEHDLAQTARKIMDGAQATGCKIILPLDVVVAKAFAAGAPHRILGIDDVSGDDMILDAGPQTVARIIDVLEGAKTLIWNGPLGAFEIAPFDAGTNAAARAAARLTDGGWLVSVAGGGDTVAALNHAGVGGAFSYVSTAGGAFLEWMEGKTLPGVAALHDAS